MPVIPCHSCGRKLDVAQRKMGLAVMCPACKGPVFAPCGPGHVGEPASPSPAPLRSRKWLAILLVASILLIAPICVTTAIIISTRQAQHAKHAREKELLAAATNAANEAVTDADEGIATLKIEPEEARSAIQKVAILQEEKEHIRRQTEAAQERVDKAERAMAVAKERKREADIAFGKLDKADQAEVTRIHDEADRGEEINWSDVVFVEQRLGTEEAREWAEEQYRKLGIKSGLSKDTTSISLPSRDVALANEDEGAANIHFGRLNAEQQAELRRIAKQAEESGNESLTGYDLSELERFGDERIQRFALEQQRVRGAAARVGNHGAPKNVNAQPKETLEEAETRKAEKTKADARAKDAKAEQNEKAAASKLQNAQMLLKSGNRAGYRNTLKELIQKYPDTKAAEKARKALK